MKTLGEPELNKDVEHASQDAKADAGHQESELVTTTHEKEPVTDAAQNSEDEKEEESRLITTTQSEPGPITSAELDISNLEQDAAQTQKNDHHVEESG